MHLHGHAFQVVNINGWAINGAMRDTVYLPPMAQVTVALDTGEAARWMPHCRNMPYLSTGVMTEFAVSARTGGVVLAPCRDDEHRRRSLGIAAVPLP